jgi:hypothetical protein
MRQQTMLNSLPMKFTPALLIIATAIGFAACSRPVNANVEVFPKIGRHYMYVGDTLTATFDVKTTAESPYYPEMFAGNFHSEPEGDLVRYSLDGGSIIFRSKKDRTEVSRLTAERIIWYAPPEKK